MLNHVMRMLVDDPDEDPIPAPCEVFDLICGTSTGGLIAILLGRLGLDCMTAISVYRELGPAVFGNDEGMMWGTILNGERFSSAGFEALLARIVLKHTGDAMALLKQPKLKPDTVEHRSTDVSTIYLLKSSQTVTPCSEQTFVTVVRAGAGSSGVEAYHLRSYALPRGAVEALPGHPWTIMEAARATSAAPMYFAPVAVGSQVFQDAGGSGFNNPTSEALKEAEMRWAGKNKGEVEYVVLSLGTGLASLIVDDIDDQQIKNSSRNLENMVNKVRSKIKNIATAKGRIGQIANQLVAVATDTERTHADVLKRFAAEWQVSCPVFSLPITESFF